MPIAAQMSVLVVDDQRAIRALVKDSLQQLGVRLIAEAEDGEMALSALRLSPVHLVISDLNMPKMDGLALLKAIRATAGLDKTAFIMLTSRGEVELVRQAVALGVNNYLTKPFTLGLLKKKIETVFGPLL
jgi:two-component system, chemotaxis family, chemotaxis protein CheY